MTPDPSQSTLPDEAYVQVSHLCCYICFYTYTRTFIVINHWEVAKLSAYIRTCIK